MKQLIFFVIFLLGFSGCSDNADAAFDIDLETLLVIPAGLNNIDTHVFEIYNVPTFIGSIRPDATPETISSVKANRATLTGRFTNLDFRIIDRISIRAISPVNPELEREVFWMDFIPLDQEGDLDLFSSLPEVKEILLLDNIHLQIRVNFKSFVPSDIESRILLNFKAFIDE